MKYWIILDNNRKKMYSLPNRTGVKDDKGEQVYDKNGIVTRKLTMEELRKRCGEEGIKLERSSSRFKIFETNNSTAHPIYYYKKENK